MEKVRGQTKRKSEILREEAIKWRVRGKNDIYIYIIYIYYIYIYISRKIYIYIHIDRDRG